MMIKTRINNSTRSHFPNGLKKYHSLLTDPSNNDILKEQKCSTRKKKGGGKTKWRGRARERAREREREREKEKEQKVRRKGKRVGDLVHYSPIIAAD